MTTTRTADTPYCTRCDATSEDAFISVDYDLCDECMVELRLDEHVSSPPYGD